MSKRVILVLMIAFLLVCCCSIFGFLGLFGNFESNGRCAYKGPLANVTSGACASAPVNDNKLGNDNHNQDEGNDNNGLSSEITYEGNSSHLFTFNYDDTSLTLDDSPSNPQILLMLNATSYENFADNVNITFSDSAMPISAATCQNYVFEVVDALTEQNITVYEDTIHGEIDIVSGQRVCHAAWEANGDGLNGDATDFEQNQFLFVDEENDRTYIITVSNEIGSPNKDIMMNVVDSFELK